MIERAAKIVATAAAALKTTDAVSALVLRSGQIVRLGEALERAVAAQAQLNRLAGELSANPADTVRVEAATTAASTLDRARSMLDAQALEIIFELEPDAAGRVQVAGSALPVGPTLLRVVEDTAIDIASIGRVRVRPAL